MTSTTTTQLPAKRKRAGASKEGFLTLHEAADWLGVDPLVVRKLVARRMLESSGRTRTQYYFFPEDVREVRKMLRGKLDPGAAVRHSLTALAIAKRAERKMNAILTTLQTDTHKPESPYRAYEKALGLLELPETPAPTPKRLLLWARRLRDLDFRALILLAWAYEGSHPWETFLNAAHRMLEAASPELRQSDPTVQLAWSMLELARRGFRQEAYLACRRMYGPGRADRLVVDQKLGSIHAAILSLL